MITDIRYVEDGTLHGKLLGCMDIYGSDLPDLKAAALEAFEAFCIACDKHGNGLKAEIVSIIEDLYSKK